MKKLLSILLVAALTATMLTSCFGKNNDTSASTPDSSTPSSSTSSDSASSDESTTEEKVVNVTAEEIYQAIDKAFADKYPEAGAAIPNMPMLVDDTVLQDKFCLSTDLVDNYYGNIAGMMTNCDMLMIVKAKEGKVEDVVKALEEAKGLQEEQFMSYPVMGNDMRLAESKVVSEGDYAALLMVGVITGDGENVDFASDVQLAEDTFRAMVKGE